MRRHRNNRSRGLRWENRKRSRRSSYGRVLYNYFRTYDPATGRYLESDLIGLDGGLNTYGYVAGNPLLNSDPQRLVISSVDAACVTNPPLCMELMGDVSRIPKNLGDRYNVCVDGYDADDFLSDVGEREL